MTANSELLHTLCAILVFLLAAHLGGFLFSRLKMPPVIGEIMGGLLLGPSFLGFLAPSVTESLFRSEARVGLILSTIYNFGSMLILFCSGLTIKSFVAGKERRLAVSVALFGSLLSLAGGIAFGELVDLRPFAGKAGDLVALKLVCAVMIAVTSLPVLTRIFMDLGMIRSSFARLCLSSSVLDDVVLYVILAIALSSVNAANPESGGVGLLPWLVKDSELWVKLIVTSLANLSFIVLTTNFAGKLFTLFEEYFLMWLISRNKEAYLLVLLVSFCILSLLLGIPLVLGAFCAGLVAARSQSATDDSVQAVVRFAGGFFVPIYFAIVGFRLDLVKDFHLYFFVGFFIFASVIRSVSTYLGSRVGGANPATSFDLAMVLNARGGSGIIVAAVAFDSGIINASLYTAFVLLSIVTSLFAGLYLSYRVKQGVVFQEEVV